MQKKSTGLISNLFPTKEELCLVLQQEETAKLSLTQVVILVSTAAKQQWKKCKEEYLEKGNNRQKKSMSWQGFKAGKHYPEVSNSNLFSLIHLTFRLW